MKKNELLALVAKKSGMTQTDCNTVIDALSEVIVEACVEQDDDVNIPNLGRFRRKVNKARKGVNPLTQKPMNIKESHNLRFTPTASIKKVIG